MTGAPRLSLLRERREAPAPEALPAWPLGWYAVARSRDLPPAGLTHGTLAARPYVLFRTESGRLAAFDAHCPHMGAHLKSATVVGERLRCALHHYHFDVTGAPEESPCRRARPWQVQECHGLVFLHLGPIVTTEVPSPVAPEGYVWTTGAPVTVSADWHSMVVNGFDMPHLSAVHQRELLAPASFGVEAEGSRFVLSYVSKVTGRGVSDRMMKWLSGNRISVVQVCQGTTVIVQTDLGFTQTSAVLSLLPVDGGVRAYSAFGIRPGSFSGLRLRLARWLFIAFLRRDFRVVEGMRLRTDVADPGVLAMASYLRALPSAAP